LLSTTSLHNLKPIGGELPAWWSITFLNLPKAIHRTCAKQSVPPIAPHGAEISALHSSRAVALEQRIHFVNSRAAEVALLGMLEAAVATANSSAS
jgi:hypothetical protein